MRLAMITGHRSKCLHGNGLDHEMHLTGKKERREQ
jgi:hypothetical protein